MSAQILGYVLADAAAERREQELRRGHALVGAAVASRLVENRSMMTRLGGKPRTAAVIEGYLQRWLLARLPEMHAAGHLRAIAISGNSEESGAGTVLDLRERTRRAEELREMTQEDAIGRGARLH